MLFSSRFLLATLVLSLASFVTAKNNGCYETQIFPRDELLTTLSADRFGNFKGTLAAAHVEADFAYQGELDKDWTLKASGPKFGTEFKLVFDLGSSSHAFPITTGGTCSGLNFNTGGIYFTPRDVKAVKWYYATP